MKLAIGTEIGMVIGSVILLILDFEPKQVLLTFILLNMGYFARVLQVYLTKNNHK